MDQAFAARGMSTSDLGARLDAEAARIGFDPALLERALNVDFSGGEKKRNETLQVAMLEPKIVDPRRARLRSRHRRAARLRASASRR